MLRGPRSGLRWLLWKLVRLGISVCLLYGFWMLLNWHPFWSLVKPSGLTRHRTGFELILAAILFWWVSVFWILFSRRRPHKLLIGPTGTGKTSIALLMTTQSKRSFYPITPADILGRYTGDSVKQVAELFSRAKGHSPPLIFIDEMDALLPRASLSLGQHDIQVVDQFLVEISSLQPENNVFPVGATNRPGNIDSRILRGGRFSEKIKIVVPGREGREKLLRKFLDSSALKPALDLEFLSMFMDGFAPADLKAICDAAKRLAFVRAVEGQAPLPLNRADFEGAISRVRDLR